jgi:hypothetical protein
LTLLLLLAHCSHPLGPDSLQFIISHLESKKEESGMVKRKDE